MKRWMGAFVIGSSLLLAAAAPPGPPAGAGPCTKEVQRLCPGVQPGQGRIRACLKEHEGELSPACREHLQAMAGRFKACADDAREFCAGIEAGEGRLRRCLRAHENELSPECRASLDTDWRPRRRAP